MAKKQCCHVPRLVYTIAGELGFTFESWTGADASGVGNPDIDQAGFEAAWSGPVVDGIPTHPNGAPTTTGVETDVRFAQSEPGQDEHRLTYWVHNDTAGPLELSDVDTRAESVQVYASCDCPGSLVHEKYQDSGAPHNSQGPFMTLPAGALVKLTVLIHDPGPDFSGFWLRANVPGDATLFDPVAYQERPTVETREILWDRCDPYVLADGEQYEPIDLDCFDCASAPAVPQPATSLPIPDNEVDTAIRTGSIGTSAEFALADHNHPIRRQANPGDITLVAGGNAVITQPTIILDRWSTEETYEFNTRTRVSQVAGTGWGWLSVPTIAGFQQPQIVGLGSYRSDSTVPQDDNGTFGAAPHGPLMAREVHHWSSTNRLYLAYFRRDNDITSLFIEAVIRYIRN